MCRLWRKIPVIVVGRTAAEVPGTRPCHRRSATAHLAGRLDVGGPERVLAVMAAIRAGLESVIIAAANQACEEASSQGRRVSHF